MAELQRGVVKWFNDAKGFGFIEHTTGRDVFVHYSVIEWEGFKTLKDGEEVEYELSEGDKGLHAAKVLRKIPKPLPGATVSETGEAHAGANGSNGSNSDGANGDSAVSMADMLEVERTPSPSEPIPGAVVANGARNGHHDTAE